MSAAADRMGCGSEVARKAPDQDRIYVAGEKEHEREAVIRKRGIPVNRNLRRDLQTVRDELGIVGYEPYF